MQAAIFAGPRRIELAPLSLPEPGPEELRVRLEGCGVCASNLPPWQGREWFTYPFAPGAPGHEAWGVVEAAGRDVRGVAVGERVAVLGDRAYATHVQVPARDAVKLPAAVEGPFPGEPLACGYNVFRRADVQPGHTLAVIGAGFIGAVVVALAHRAGARVVAVSRRESSLELARRYGADLTISMEDHGTIVREVQGWAGDEGCDRVIEAVGAQWPLDLAGVLTRTHGKLVIAGYHQDGPRQVDMQLWNWRGIDVINAHERDPQVVLDGIRAAADDVAARRLDFSPLFTHTFSLDELGAALELTERRPAGFVKALVTFP